MYSEDPYDMDPWANMAASPRIQAPVMFTRNMVPGPAWAGTAHLRPNTAWFF
jgi:hypothetical protein